MRFLVMVIAALLGLKVPLMAATAAPAPAICVTLPPYAFLLRELLGPDVSVTALVQGGQDPHTFELSPSQMQQLSKCQLYFTIKFPFETTLLARLKSLNPHMQVIDITDGVKFRQNQNAHEGEALDPHIWTAPANIKTQLQTIERQLALFPYWSQHPERLKKLQAQSRHYQEYVTLLSDQLAQRLGPTAGETVLVFHPSYGYLFDQYKIGQLAIENEGKAPSAKHLAALRTQVQKQKISRLLLRPQEQTLVPASFIEELKLQVIISDPLREHLFAFWQKLMEDWSRPGHAGRSQ